MAGTSKAGTGKAGTGKAGTGKAGEGKAGGERRAKAVHKAREGSAVTWAWGTGEGHGKVVSVFTKRVTRVIEGKRISRVASEERPAYLIATDKGGKVLKSSTEVGAAR